MEKQESEVNDAVLQLLRKVLADVQTGGVQGVCLVACLSGGNTATAMAGELDRAGVIEALQTLNLRLTMAAMQGQGPEPPKDEPARIVLPRMVKPPGLS